MVIEIDFLLYFFNDKSNTKKKIIFLSICQVQVLQKHTEERKKKSYILIYHKQ